MAFTTLQEGEELVKQVGAISVFEVKDGPNGMETTWLVDMKNGNGSVSSGPGT